MNEPLATVRRGLAVLLMIPLIACSPAAEQSTPVTSREQALEAVRSHLGAAEFKDRPLTVTRDDKAWVVALGARPGDPGQNTVSVTVDAKTGRTLTYSAEVTDVAIIKPPT